MVAGPAPCGVTARGTRSSARFFRQSSSPGGGPRPADHLHWSQRAADDHRGTPGCRAASIHRAQRTRGIRLGPELLDALEIAAPASEASEGAERRVHLSRPRQPAGPALDVGGLVPHPFTLRARGSPEATSQLPRSRWNTVLAKGSGGRVALNCSRTESARGRPRARSRRQWQPDPHRSARGAGAGGEALGPAPRRRCRPRRGVPERAPMRRARATVESSAMSARRASQLTVSLTGRPTARETTRHSACWSRASGESKSRPPNRSRRTPPPVAPSQRAPGPCPRGPRHGSSAAGGPAFSRRSE